MHPKNVKTGLSYYSSQLNLPALASLVWYLHYNHVSISTEKSCSVTADKDQCGDIVL